MSIQTHCFKATLFENCVQWWRQPPPSHIQWPQSGFKPEWEQKRFKCAPRESRVLLQFEVSNQDSLKNVVCSSPRHTLPEKPRFYLRHEQEATGGAGSRRHQPVCAVHLLPSAVTAAQKASDVQHGSRSLTLCLTALHLHVSSQSSPRLCSNRATGKQDQACPRRGAACNCSNKVSLQNR